MAISDSTSHKGCCAPARATKTGLDSPPTTAPSEGIDQVKILSIPGGSGWIGTDHPKVPNDGEEPLRHSKIRNFRMDATTVTNTRFAAFVTTTGYVTEAERLGDSFVFAGFLQDEALDAPLVSGTPWWRIVSGANWRAIYGPGTEAQMQPDHPVVHVSWHDAKAFAAWAGGRLPSEAEWEHAARGGQGDVPFPWGQKDPNDIDNFPCNIWQGSFPEQNDCHDGFMGTAPARSFAPNPYGLYNMVGNVWEWTSQPFKVRSLKKAVHRLHGSKTGYKTIKGGSFLCHSNYCYRYRIAARSSTSPDSAMSHQGFRLVYDEIDED